MYCVYTIYPLFELMSSDTCFLEEEVYMDTKEKKVNSKEQERESELKQNCGKAHFSDRTKIAVSNIRGIIIIVLIILFMIYLFTAKDNKIRRVLSENFLVIILIIYITLMFIVNFFRSEKVDEIIKTVQRKGNVNSLITNIFLVSLLTIFLSVQSNQNEQRQIEIADRETAPSLRITS